MSPGPRTRRGQGVWPRQPRPRDTVTSAELMIDHGVADVATYVVNRIDTDYFEEA